MSIEITRTEAEEALIAIEAVTNRMRKTIAGCGAGPILIMWGLIWLVGYSSSQFFPENSGLIWAPLSLGGGAASWIIGMRERRIKGVGSWRIGVFWLVLFGYAALWAILLHPFNSAHTGAYLGTVPMFAYVVGGLWVGRFFVWLGLSVTVILVLGVFAWPAWAQLWSGIAGGGSLLAAGIYIRRYWR